MIKTICQESMILAVVLVFLVSSSEASENEFNDSLPTFRQNQEQNQCDCYYQDSCGCICSRPITWSQFQMLPQNFKPCRGFTLALRGGQFYAFPSDYFYRVGHVGEFVLDVGNVNFQYLNDPEGVASPYNGVTFETSAYIRMYKVTVLREWNWSAFNNLAPSLQKAYCEIQIVQSTLSTLRAEFGQICQGAVTVVNVLSSGTTTLENSVFNNFYKLNEVDLSNNRIQEMRRSYFSLPARELEVMTLAYNNIRVLPQDMFSQMPSLHTVNLQGNPLTALDERTFRPIFRNVEIVGLDTLPLSCDCKARWLKEPNQLCGVNVYGLAAVRCEGPEKFKGYSFFNDTLPKDLVC